MGDKYGRKKMFQLGMVISLVLYTLVFLCNNIYFMIAIFFCYGMNTSLQTNIGYIYLYELMPVKAQTPITSIWNI